MKAQWNLRLGLASAALAAALAIAGGAAAGSGTQAAVSAVEGQSFSGAVATYTSSVTPNQRFVGQADLDLVGRPPTNAELAFFGAFLANGGTRTQVAKAILGSDEYHGVLVGSVYQRFLRRAPGSIELAAGVAFLKAGETDEQLNALVLGSPEYLATQGGGTVDGFLNALYLDVLGRPIDAAAKALFTQQLASAKTRDQVALAVLTSIEAQQDLLATTYQRFLKRSPSALELQAALGLLASGTDEGVIALLVGSAEYFQDVPASLASATIDWGDGSPSSKVGDAASTIGGSHTYTEEGSYPIRVVVSDLDGTTAIAAQAAVADAPLSASAISFSAAKKAIFTQTVARFTDTDPAGAASDFTATIAWGDGQSSMGTISPAASGGFAVAGSHTYTTKGNYLVAVHVADAGGATANVAGTAQVTAKGQPQRPSKARTASTRRLSSSLPGRWSFWKIACTCRSTARGLR